MDGMETFDSLLADAVRKAMVEISEKTMQDLQRETAFTWLGRCVATFTRFAETSDLQDLCDAEEFGHEAIEHASLADEPGFSDAISQVVHVCRGRALARSASQ